MTIASIRASLTDTASSAVSARMKHNAMPQAPPQAFPAVYVVWVRSVTAAASYQVANTMQSKRRTHTFDLIVFVGSTNNAPASDTATLKAVNDIINALENSTIASQGHVEVVEITPYSLSADDTNLLGFRATVEVTEWE